MGHAPNGLEQLLESISAEVETGGIVSLHRIPAREGQSLAPDPPVPRAIWSRLEAKGVRGLWSHQIEALDAVRSGRNTIVATGTASGKSLCFNLPVFEGILGQIGLRALYLYPTKALAQDQLRAIREFGLPQVAAATYDGDTPADERDSVRRYASIVLSNPDMVHYGILPAHRRWGEFLRKLAFIVIDEAHILRGVFGSHVGCILRRLERVVRHYGANPVFILASATIANPGDLARRLIGQEFVEVTADGSPSGPRMIAFWNPPLLERTQGKRSSSNWESARILAALCDEGVRTIAFNKSQRGAEVVARHSRSIASSETRRRIRPYRAGYLASERRELEKQIFSGQLLGVSSTTALELGIDVGGLDAVVMNGFPGTVAATWQQAGRAGRGHDEAAAVLVGGDDPLDQYYLNHPDALLSKRFESALVDVANPNILRPHLGCAAYELPLGEGESAAVFGEAATVTVDAMAADGDLSLKKARGAGDRRWHWSRRGAPGRGLDIRSAGGTPYSIVESTTGALLGTVDAARAFKQVHAGAIYLHQAVEYEVISLDQNARVAEVVPSQAGHFTQAREISEIRVVKARSTRRVGAADFWIGEVEVAEQVVGYVKRSVSTGKTIGSVRLDLPKQTLSTVAVWYTVPAQMSAAAGVGDSDLPGALHAAEHAGIGILPVFAMADRWDIGGLSTNYSPDTGLPTVFIYDGHPGGVGIAQRGFDQAEDHLRATFETIRNCPCDAGCPSCIQSPKCGNGNEPLDKSAAARLLKVILGDQTPR